jgi:uncharacterized membrane protein YfcA
VSAVEALLLVLAGLGAGLVGSIAGLASLISYPALLALGLPPVMANVTNTVALVFSSGGSVLASGPELGGQGTRLRRLGVVAVLGGVLGGVLLLITPAGFSRGSCRGSSRSGRSRSWCDGHRTKLYATSA